MATSLPVLSVASSIHLNLNTLAELSTSVSMLATDKTGAASLTIAKPNFNIPAAIATLTLFLQTQSQPIIINAVTALTNHLIELPTESSNTTAPTAADLTSLLAVVLPATLPKGVTRPSIPDSLPTLAATCLSLTSLTALLPLRTLSLLVAEYKVPTPSAAFYAEDRGHFHLDLVSTFARALFKNTVMLDAQTTFDHEDIPAALGVVMEKAAVAAKLAEREINAERKTPAVIASLEDDVGAAWRLACPLAVGVKDHTAFVVADTSKLMGANQAWALAANEAAANAVPAPPAAAAAPPAAAEDDKAFEGKTPEQIAKMKKVRAEKAEKAAKKAAAKAAKKASSSGAATAVPAAITSFLALPLLCPPTPSSSAQLSNFLSTLTSSLTSKRKPKVAKGMRDYLPSQMTVRQKAFSIIRRVFQSHGAVEIDTPVMELKNTLTGKYGEDSKLIYDLADQGGETLALRYDLTVPFARFLALNGVGNIKRFHIGKVYRRDQPAMNKGRYREFYQCDFDIAGVYPRMVPDSEAVAVACEILAALPIGDFQLKVNHRKLLDAILEVCGCPSAKFRTICSAVDKLDKEPWEVVKAEMVEKGLTEAVADKIGTFVLLKSDVTPFDLYEKLTKEKSFGAHEGAATALEDLRIMFNYLEAMGALKYISFDLSLARGLDYYTGVIYEAVCIAEGCMVGSIGGGGRYDGLAGMFAGEDIPCVGVSVGVERVFTLMEKNMVVKSGVKADVDVMVASTTADEANLQKKMAVTKKCWEANIKAEFATGKLKQSISEALERDVKFIVVVGDEEWTRGVVKVKNLATRTEEEVEIEGVVAKLRELGCVPVGCEFAVEQGLIKGLESMKVE